ncbi:MAG: hypothetical protein IKY91_04855 [Akkermansia sp.]|nr:hypothetical protein [Akkermansia sp.]
MAEYIDKSVLIAVCKGIAAFDWNKKAAPVSWADAYERFADEVEDFDAADVVERKRGRWILRHVGHGHYWECSECHQNPCIYVTKDTNFCPNCGADMREADHAKT